MGKKGGRNKLKRLAAPKSWDISRKSSRFVFKPRPGPHSTSASYPLGLVVRSIGSTEYLIRELNFMLQTGKVLVDGKERRETGFPVGLFDLVSVPSEGATYRMLPTPKGLVPSKVPEGESGRKLCSVKAKTTVKGGHTQYGLHDGRSILGDGLGLSPGDSVLLEVPSQKVVGQAKLQKGSLGMVLTGERAGQLGKIAEVKKGTVSREKMVKIALASGDAEIPSRLVFPVGSDKPLIGIGVASA